MLEARAGVYLLARISGEPARHGAQLVEAPALALDLGLEQGKNLCKTHGIHFLVVHSRHLPKSELIITQRLYHIYPWKAVNNM